MSNLPKVSKETAVGTMDRIVRDIKNKSIREVINEQINEIAKENPDVAIYLTSFALSKCDISHLTAAITAGLFVYRSLRDQIEINELKDMSNLFR